MDQLALPGAQPAGPKRRGTKRAKVRARATVAPIARIVIDLKTPTLDRIFDYEVPAELADTALPGCRVRVRFGHRLVNGYLVERVESTDHTGALTPLKAILGPPVLTEGTLQLSRDVARRYAGSLAEVLRDAIPKRLAAVEGSPDVAPVPGQPAKTLSSRAPIRTSLVVPIVESPGRALCDLIRERGAGAVVVVPDQSRIEAFRADFEDTFGDRLAVLSSQDSAADRYREFLRVVNRRADVVLGTRHAVFAPVLDDAQVIVWDDGDESLSEPRSPGWHAREVAALRSLNAGNPLVLAGYVQSVEVARLVETGWLSQDVPSRQRRACAPRVLTSADQPSADATSHARIPHFAWQVLRRGLTAGPVLVQVARSGYLPTMACRDCGDVALCRICSGTLGSDPAGNLTCQWCGTSADGYLCPSCNGHTLRAMRVGSSRTAEELQAAFPDVPVVVSGRQVGMLGTVSDERLIVVSTPGAEPIAEHGYAAALLLDGDALLARADLRTEEQTIRRWFAASALVRPNAQGGTIAITADPRNRCVQALVRSEPTHWARTEYLDRLEAQLPPSVRSAAVSGAARDVEDFLGAVVRGHSNWRVLGPAAVRPGRGQTATDRVRSIVLTPTADGQVLADALRAGRLAEGTKAAAEGLRIRMDPLSLASDQ